MTRSRRHLTRPRIIGAVALVALLVAMAMDSRFVTPEELAGIGPESFDPEQTAQELFDESLQSLPQQAAPLPEVLAALQRDVDEAAEQYEAARPNDTTMIIPVSGRAEVAGSTGQAIELRIDGVAGSTPITLANNAAINGTVLRDGLGFGFADAPNQSAFQRVGDNLKALMQEQVRQGVGAGDPRQGAALRFVGMISVTDTGTPLSPQKPVSIQPVQVEAAR